MRNPEIVEYSFDNIHPGNDNDAFMITSVTNLRTQVWMATHEYTVSIIGAKDSFSMTNHFTTMVEVASESVESGERVAFLRGAQVKRHYTRRGLSALHEMLEGWRRTALACFPISSPSLYHAKNQYRVSW